METLQHIQNYLTSKNIVLCLVTAPYRQQVNVANLVGATYNANYPQEFIKEFASSNGIPYLDLLPLLREQVREMEKEIYVRA